jgi:hypothetical protein
MALKVESWHAQVIQIAIGTSLVYQRLSGV